VARRVDRVRDLLPSLPGAAQDVIQAGLPAMGPL
jgi:hypothetical protein